MIAFLQDQPSLLYFHEKEMLKRESLREKIWKRKLECNLVPYLFAGKIVSIVIIIADKYSNQVWGSRKLILCLEKHLLRSYCILIIMHQLKSLKFWDKWNYFQTYASTYFSCLPYLMEKEKDEKLCVFLGALSRSFDSENELKNKL